MAWGWRVLSSGEPFTEGRPDEEHGNDKVVIVLTDGANLYGPETPSAYGYVEHPTRPAESRDFSRAPRSTRTICRMPTPRRR